LGKRKDDPSQLLFDFMKPKPIYVYRDINYYVISNNTVGIGITTTTTAINTNIIAWDNIPIYV
jgi:hypothetical protein